MKKISAIALLTTIVLPVMAQDAVVEQYSEQFKEPVVKNEYSNPKIKFPHGLQLGVGLSGTSGFNAFVGYNNKKFDSFWWKRLGIRFDFATFSIAKSSLNNQINRYIGDDGIKINDNLKIDNVSMDAKHFGAMIDFYPFGDTWFLGGWRISGGYMTGNLDLNANIKGTEKLGKIEFELGGYKYAYAGSEMQGKANVNWKYSGPYVGTGFDFGLFAGLKLYFDAGVVFTDNHAKIDLNVPINNLQTIGGIDISSDPAAAPEVQAAYAQFEAAKAKAIVDAQKELDKIPVYPLVKVGLMYRF